MTIDNRVARNQAPPLVGHNTVTSDAALVEADRAARVGRDPFVAAGAGRRGGFCRGPRAGHARQRVPPRADSVRPLRQPHRRGALPPLVALAARARGGSRAAGGAVGVRRPARTPTPRGRVLRLADRARARLPDLDDVRRDPRAAGRRRDREGVDAEAGCTFLRPRSAAARGEVGRPRGHGHDREAGRLRRTRQRDRGAADVGGRRVHPARPQVVHLRADERRLPRAGAGAGRSLLLPGATRAALAASATGSTSYASRTSWATAPTRRPSSSSTAPGRSGSATRVAAYARSSRWSPPPGSTACSARRR